MEDPNLLKIMAKLSSMEAALPDIKKEIVDLKIRLLDPDAGLYTRVKDLRVWSAEAGKEFDNIQEQIEQSEERFLQKEKEVHNILAKIQEQMEPLAEMEERRLARKKWIEKIVWVVVPIVIAAMTKGILSVIDIQEMLQKQQKRFSTNISQQD